MRLESVDGLFVELEVSSYQFGSRQSSSDGSDWDANWLVISGKVCDGDRSWEFRDPCMTTWEARELASWLSGWSTPGSRPSETAERRLWMTEPNLTFESGGATDALHVVDVFFDAEARPPTGSNDEGQGVGHRVRLTISQADIAAAVLASGGGTTRTSRPQARPGRQDVAPMARRSRTSPASSPPRPTANPAGTPRSGQR